MMGLLGRSGGGDLPEEDGRDKVRGADEVGRKDLIWWDIWKFEEERTCANLQNHGERGCWVGGFGGMHDSRRTGSITDEVDGGVEERDCCRGIATGGAGGSAHSGAWRKCG